jgi:hypothetical protein
MAAWTAGVISAREIPRNAALSTRAAAEAVRPPADAAGARRRVADRGSVRAPVTFMGFLQRLTIFDVTAVKRI